MKRIIIISATVLAFYAISQVCGCDNCNKANSQTLSSKVILKDDNKTVKLKVKGMTCGGCSNNIHNALSKKIGIIENEVKFPGDVAIVKYDPEKISLEEIIKTIEKAGYKESIAEKQPK